MLFDSAADRPGARGTLDAADYSRFERLVATKSGPLEQGKPVPDRVAMPRYVYACNPSVTFDGVHTLGIGGFSGDEGDSATVARYLPVGLIDSMPNAHLFDRATRDTGEADAVISGRVTRTSSYAGYYSDGAGAQVEARLTVGGRDACAMQINIVGKNVGIAGGFAGLIVAGLEGDRASMISAQMVDIRTAVKHGEREGIYLGRYGMPTQASNIVAPSAPATTTAPVR